MEQTTEPILRPMISGQETTLTREHQSIIALWTIKAAMVLDSMSSESVFYEQSERFDFRTSFSLPGFVTFWLGHYSGTHWGGFTSHRILTTRGYVPEYKRFILTMAFGNLVLQFVNTKLNKPVDNVGALTFKMKKGKWTTVEFGPHLTDSIQWPPPGPSFDDSKRKLIMFSERFGGPTSKSRLQ